VVALEQGGHDSGIQVDASHEVHQGRAGLGGRPVWLASDAHDARGGLDGEIHRQVVAIGSGDAEAGAGGIDQPGVHRLQHVIADAQIVHRARRKVLQQHIGPGHHLLQQLPPARGLQVQCDGALVGVQHRHRERGVTRAGGEHAATQRLSGRRLDLDDVRTGFRHQERGIRALVDLPEIQDGDTCQRCGHGDASYREE
jgi:hypothetical protein